MIEKPEIDSTKMGRFLARRGTLIIKETRPIGRFFTTHEDVIQVHTMIIALGNETNRQMIFGVKIEHMDQEDKILCSVLIDFDELDELLGALDLIQSTAADLMDLQRDYTECEYVTKDVARFGFYQNKQEQQGYLSLVPGGDSIFVAVDDFGMLGKLMAMAQSHLVSCGASNES